MEEATCATAFGASRALGDGGADRAASVLVEAMGEGSGDVAELGLGGGGGERGGTSGGGVGGEGGKGHGASGGSGGGEGGKGCPRISISEMGTVACAKHCSSDGHGGEESHEAQLALPPVYVRPEPIRRSRGQRG